MQEPEEYNVIHIGPESENPLDRALVREAKKGKLSGMAGYISMAVMFLGFGILNLSFQLSLSENDEKIAALIDEVGSLSQANFVLSEQVISQEGVLQSIEKDFSHLDEAVSTGDTSVMQQALQNILGKLSEVGDAAVNLSEDLLGVSNDETFDILVLGTNGAHTDSIMVASINEEKEKISLFSIPRDLYINGRRINAYYTYYGVDQLERMVESVTGLEMDKYVQVDLAGFTEIVDILGGLDIYVSEDIYDSLYPNGKGGYLTYSISKGLHQMDGTEALRYARSRESTSDFDRSERQQVVMTAVRNKLMELDGLMDIKQLTAIFQTVMEYTATNMDLLDIVGYYYDYKDYDLNTGFGLTSGNYLYSVINESGAYVLLPKTGNFEEIQGVISDLVN
ncbi:hypothetical protein A3J23_03435 [Candidatus Peregrinibacteria bacterium RIFCSPLOWO2_02_FULL_48_14]|nr:MAG: hypothetical protein A3J23_03435 [Candidatus Peregrinibacteria bacterium RIFCSPLOWO2_02_FULL_48_14]